MPAKRAPKFEQGSAEAKPVKAETVRPKDRAYNPQAMEQKWQSKWEVDQLYRAVIDETKPKHYALTMLPYTSGDLHFGHWYPMAPSDARARYKRMNGYNVLFPIGFDAFGLPGENAAIKRAMRRRLEASLGLKEIPEDPMFVGFARPSYRSLVDPHEDVGFILLFRDHAEFFGEKDRVMLPKGCLARVRLRVNPHSWALLGGWVSLEGVLEGKPVRMLLEPREAGSLRGNRKLRRALMKQIEDWLALPSEVDSGVPATVPPDSPTS